MPVSAEVRARLRGFLPVDAEIRYVFPAFRNDSASFYVVVTNNAITVVANRRFSRTHPKTIWRTFPRDVRIGPVDTHLAPTFELGGREFVVDEEYIPVLNAADAELAPNTLPPDPLRDLE
ncbi:hypothetical protein NI17_013950 [Thermobifida halotolerans]|uniref:Uncharacterized protein n=1 Tax=Thermobifida halotolerans TaxID=483545 RepID=A0A399G5B8_9ACTN|nr:hypothetical protein [Thermobifida halotolerans]UOE17964.1 hypothetical protein NI17_013950 [Thermobifida halotolerans]